MFLLLFTIGLLTNLVYAAPISKRMVDMTHTFDETTLNWPRNKPFKMDNVFNGTTEQGFWLQTEEISSALHVGTHMDAPAHAFKGGLTVNQIPVDKLIAPAAVVDITARAEVNPDEVVTVDDLLQWELDTRQSLNGTVLLLRTGWGRKWNNRTAFVGTPDDDVMKLHFPGLAEEAVHWLVAHRNIVGIGTEALSFDAGTSRTFTAHRVLFSHGVFGLENIANMDQIPIYGATLYIMPSKIGKASGAATRIIATYPEPGISLVREIVGKISLCHYDDGKEKERVNPSGKNEITQ